MSQTGGWGIFQETTTLFNRGREAVSVRFDGSEKTLYPGNNTSIPLLAVPYARKQNPIMGSEEFLNPGASGYQSLIIDLRNPKTKHLAVPMTDEEWAAHKGSPTRLNVADMEEEKGVKLIVKGKRMTMATSFEAREGGGAAEYDHFGGPAAEANE